MATGSCASGVTSEKLGHSLHFEPPQPLQLLARKLVQMNIVAITPIFLINFIISNVYGYVKITIKFV